MGQNLLQAFELMFTGMLGVFIALGIIYLAVRGLQRLFPEKSEESKQD